MKITFTFLELCPREIVLPPTRRNFAIILGNRTKSINRFLDCTRIYIYTAAYAYYGASVRERPVCKTVVKNKGAEGETDLCHFFLPFADGGRKKERRRREEWGEREAEDARACSRQMQSSILDSLFALYSRSTGLSFHVLSARRFADCPLDDFARELSLLPAFSWRRERAGRRPEWRERGNERTRGRKLEAAEGYTLAHVNFLMFPRRYRKRPQAPGLSISVAVPGNWARGPG